MPDETFHSSCPVVRLAAIILGFGAVPVEGEVVAYVVTDIIDS
jgi:hypothetical protein